MYEVYWYFEPPSAKGKKLEKYTRQFATPQEAEKFRSEIKQQYPSARTGAHKVAYQQPEAQ